MEDSEELEGEELEKKALQVAVRFISYQPRSVLSARKKLLDKEFPEDIIETTIGKLIKAKYLDDNLYSKLLFNEAISKNYGLQKIKKMLYERGISREMIANLLENNDSEDELERAKAAAEKRAKRLTGFEPEKQRQRLMSYLLRQGFNTNTAGKTCNLFINNSRFKD